MYSCTLYIPRAKLGSLYTVSRIKMEEWIPYLAAAMICWAINPLFVKHGQEMGKSYDIRLQRYQIRFES